MSSSQPVRQKGVAEDGMGDLFPVRHAVVRTPVNHSL